MKNDSFSHSIESCSKEGVRIITENPKLSACLTIYVLFALLLSLIIWAFWGKADVMIVAEGQLEPKSEMRRIYSPAPGQLVEMKLTEGAIVSKGDMIARIKADGAIKAASEAEQAKIQMEQIDFERKILPQKKVLTEKEIANLKQQIRHKQEEYEKLKTERFRNLPESRKHKLNKASLQLETAGNDKKLALQMFEKYRRLYDSPGHGGISKKELEDKEAEYLKAENNYRSLKTDLEALEIEFSQQETQAGIRIAETYHALLNLSFQSDTKMLQSENEEKILNMRYQAAKAAYEALSVVTFSDLDKDNFLKIKAPVSGVITSVFSTQPGEKVSSETPLLSIAPEDSEKMVFIRIREKDRGLLKIGQPVRLKFTAYPFYRYGIIAGTLEHISPDVTVPKEGSSYYKGKVSLERDYVTFGGKKIPIRYGMNASAEIVLQKRRLIDLFSEPFRKLKVAEGG